MEETEFYRGHEFSVVKEGKEWVATCGRFRTVQRTRKRAIEIVQHHIDQQEVALPAGFDSAFQEWTKQVQAVATRLDPNDTFALSTLKQIKRSFDMLEALIRSQRAGQTCDRPSGLAASQSNGLAIVLGDLHG